MSAITDYLRTVREIHRSGGATEHSYRPVLKTLLEALRPGVVVINEPKRNSDYGAVDMRVSDGGGPDALTLGYVECKDTHVPLDDAAKSDQLKRYRDNLPNLVLTNHLEFRSYVEGEERLRVALASCGAGALTRTPGGEEELRDLLHAFLSRTPAPITSPRELAQAMVDPTRMIRHIIIQQFNHGDRSGETWALYEAFQQTLLPNIKPAEFADMFAQTLAYGLFAARVNHPAGQPFTRRDAPYEIPATNPFLRKLFASIAGPELEHEPYVGYVDDLARLLAHADIGAILADFGSRTRQEDPIVHFYETFLAAYDPKLREMRGVYYTPEPVVSYIVRSVDWILKEHFGLEGGLANEESVSYQVTLPDGSSETRTSPKVLILDPACGTGTFLYHVIEHIRRQFVQSNNAGKWPGFVREQLLPRLFGFELLMAPYAVAHLKLGMQLAALDMTEEQRAKWAYDFEDGQRLGVYLTNTLEEAGTNVQTRAGIEGAIIAEGNAAAEVKRELPIMVVLGNPPYSGISANNGKWINQLLRGRISRGEDARTHRKVGSYYEVDGEPLGERKVWLGDDYVKFIRFAQWRIEETGVGLLGLITNHAYLDNPTFRGMRQSLLTSFTDIFILNLHGNTLTRETAPDGSRDDNVFDIKQGVAIGIFVRRSDGGRAAVHYADLWGDRSGKYEKLDTSDTATIEWRTVSPCSPFYLFVPEEGACRAEYLELPAIQSVFGDSVTGVQTSRDSFATDVSREDLLRRIRDFASPDLSDDLARSRYGLKNTRGWDLVRTRKHLRKQCWEEDIAAYSYRPFDLRWIHYSPLTVDWPRSEVMGHMRNPNAALCVGRAGHVTGDDTWNLCSCSQQVVDLNYFYRGGAQTFPLYLYPDPTRLKTTPSPWPEGRDGRRPNFSKAFVDEFAGKLGLEFVSDGRGDLQATFGPEDIFDYIYAVFHSPTYRERYAEFLKIDFPRVPLTSDADLFRDLVGLGGELVRLHLMEHPDLAREANRISYPNAGGNEVEKGHPKYYAPGEVAPGEAEPLARGRVYINGTKRKAGAPAGQYFHGIAPEVWAFQVGGYQVLDKWLKDRRGRTLSYEDIEHYQRVVVALERTMALMAEIDARIEEWPIGENGGNGQ